MADLRIVDAPLLSTVKGTEKLPTGGEGNFSVSVNQVADFTKLKWVLATEGYVNNAVGNVQADLNLHKNSVSNPHQVTKTQVGLGNVDNTADLDKPVSNATQSAIITANSGKADKSYVDSQDQIKADKVTVEASLLLKADKVDLTASKILSDGGQTQQVINDFGGAKWYNKVGGYDLGATVKLENGDIVKSTIPNNTVNPNIDTNGWGSNLNYTNFSMFNADPTGITACDTQIIKAFNSSRDKKKKLINSSGVYLLNGSQNIEIAFDYDLTGTVFKLGPSFTGSIKITKNAVTTRYDSGSVLTKFQSVGVFPAGKSNLTGVTSADGLDNQYVKFYFNQPMYTYRGIETNRFELNRILKRGQMLGSFMYDANFSLLTAVDLQPVSNTVLCGNGLTIDETSLANNVSIVKIDDGNGFDLKNFKFIDSASAVATNTKDKITLGINAHDIRIDYVDTSATYINSLNEASYTITMFENFGVELEHICSDGYGWGATGSSNCRRVSLKNSQLSRVDFHKPCHEWLKINDCVIGNWGVLVTMLGDLTISDTTFNMRSGYSNNGFIRSREDMGGFCNGKLTMNNITIDGDSSVGVKALLRCQRTATNIIPAGSPIRPEFWTDIEVDGLDIKRYVVSPLIESNMGTDLDLMLPKSIVLNHIYSDIPTQLNLNVHQFKKRDEGVRYVLDDTRLSYLAFIDSTAVGTKVNASVSKLRGLSAFLSTQIDNTCAGDFTFVDANISKYREFSGGWSVGSPFVKFIGGELKNTTDAIYFDCQAAARSRIKLLGTRLTYGDVGAMKGDLNFFSARNCTWNGEDYFPLYSGDGSASTTTFTLPISGDITLIIRNNSGKIDTITVSTTAASTMSIPNTAGTITTTIGSTASIKVDAATLLSVGLVSS